MPVGEKIASSAAVSSTEDQENLNCNKNFITKLPGKIDENSSNSNNSNSNLNGTPIDGAKANKSRRILAEKTPNNVKRPLQTAQSPSPTVSHPSLRDIAITTKALSNPPDLFLQPIQKRRNLTRPTNINDFSDLSFTECSNLSTAKTVSTSSKLIVVFPTTSDEFDPEDEIEHAAGSLNNDDDSLDCLSGKSKIIPNLELHENIDFTPLLREGAAKDQSAPIVPTEVPVVIEPIFVDFKLENNNTENALNDNVQELIES